MSASTRHIGIGALVSLTFLLLTGCGGDNAETAQAPADSAKPGATVGSSRKPPEEYPNRILEWYAAPWSELIHTSDGAIVGTIASISEPQKLYRLSELGRRFEVNVESVLYVDDEDRGRIAAGSTLEVFAWGSGKEGGPKVSGAAVEDYGHLRSPDERIASRLAAANP
jgi:hypothetical protein